MLDRVVSIVSIRRGARRVAADGQNGATRSARSAGSARRQFEVSRRAGQPRFRWWEEHAQLERFIRQCPCIESRRKPVRRYTSGKIILDLVDPESDRAVLGPVSAGKRGHLHRQRVWSSLVRPARIDKSHLVTVHIHQISETTEFTAKRPNWIRSLVGMQRPALV